MVFRAELTIELTFRIEAVSNFATLPSMSLTALKILNAL
jgi:hypothetical protein